MLYCVCLRCMLAVDTGGDEITHANYAVSTSYMPIVIIIICGCTTAALIVSIIVCVTAICKG